MPHADPRFTHVAKMVAAQLGVTAQAVDKAAKASLVDEFLGAGADGVEPRMALLFFKQGGDVIMSTGDDVPLTGQCCYVVRVSDPTKELPTKDLEDSLNFGTLSGSGSPMQTLKMMVNELYRPLIAKDAFKYLSLIHI